jgi:hypothetical protein
MSETFILSDTNPNDGIGGGGCLCHPLKCLDCKGPYAIFPATETDSNLSPHAVLSLACAKQIAAKAKRKDQIVSAGERDTALADPQL